MKLFHRELTLLAAAALMGAFLTNGTALAGENKNSVTDKNKAAVASENKAPVSTVSVIDVQEKDQKKALAAIENAAEELEKKASEETKKKAEEAAAQKAIKEEAEKTMREAAEKAAKEVAELKALGLCADPRVRVSAEELDLLAAIIHCEAGGEEMTGRIAVGAVVLNRVQSTEFENTIYEVVYAPGQFTPAMTGLLDQTLAEGVDDECYAAARAALNGENPVGDCLYFNCGYGQGIQIGYQHFY